MPDDEISKQRASSILTAYGFSVKAIPRDPCQRTADLLVTDGLDSFFIEVKDKLDDAERLENEQRQLRAQGSVTRLDPLAYKNNLSAIVRDAADQLSAQPGSPHDFRLIWLNALGRDPDLQRRQFRATLYGVEWIIDPAPASTRLDCYYFNFNAFFDLSTRLEGAIVFWINPEGPKWQLHVNSFSPFAVHLRETRLYRLFLPDGLEDPDLREKAGQAYVANCDISRHNPQEVLQFIRDKYHQQSLIHIAAFAASGELYIPESADPSSA